MKIPVLILHNTSSQAPRIGGAVDFAASFRSEFRLVWSLGEIMRNISAGLIPPVEFTVVGSTWSGYVNYAEKIEACPQQAMWTFIWGRFTVSFGDFFFCSLTPDNRSVCQRLEERLKQ